jgi:hypothetical protein
MSSARVTKMALSTGLPFGAVMALVLGLQRGPLVGAISGVFAGVLFGGMLAAFAEVQRRRMEIKGGTFEGEPILYQGPANHWLGAEARGGWLVLTPRRLAFRSHGKNIQNAGVDLPLGEVAGYEASRSLGIIPNQLRVRRRDGAVDKFVVTERAAWLTALASAQAGFT